MLKPYMLSAAAVVTVLTAAPSTSAITTTTASLETIRFQSGSLSKSTWQTALWSAGNDVDGPYITDGSTKIKMKSDRHAKKTAKKFNKLESDGFKVDPDSECGDPLSGVLC